jgi:hypothetical protein
VHIFVLYKNTKSLMTSITHDNSSVVSSNNYTYNEKINSIHNYFGVSTNAAKYMFNRRRRGFPWKKSNDVNYLKWDIQLQNAFIEADTLLNFNWGNLKFSNDIQILSDYGITIESQLKTVNKNVKPGVKKIKENTDGEWTVVTTNRKKLNEKHVLKFIGFLPKSSKN